MVMHLCSVTFCIPYNVNVNVACFNLLSYIIASQLGSKTSGNEYLIQK